jgi:hypothetical protein
MNSANNEQRQLEIDAERESILRSSTWPEMLRATLKLVTRRPELVNLVGVKPISSEGFAANAKIYAQFTGRKPNTVRLAFRTHGIPTLDQVPSHLTLGLINARFWKLHFARNNIFESNPRDTFRFVRYPHRVKAEPSYEQDDTDWMGEERFLDSPPDFVDLDIQFDE